MASRANSSSMSFIDNSRRTFRGRAGPTDGKLNKYQARRRKHDTRNVTGRNNKYGDEVCNKQETTAEDESEQEEIIDEELFSTEIEQDNEVDGVENNLANDEIQHLMRRVRNVRESIQLSATANLDPSIWQQNVLNPVKNCVGEWRAIVNHYQNELEPEDRKAPALAVYELIQMAMQSGPLAGAKPGYFKRCGSESARQALFFLDSTLRDKDEPSFLHFTQKQAVAIDKWKNNARRAVEDDKPPSKSALKKQNSSKKKK
jgi:hypothetical protein